MILEKILPCSFEKETSGMNTFWGYLGSSQAARFEAKSDTKIELYSYPLVMGRYSGSGENEIAWTDAVEKGNHSLSCYFFTKDSASFSLRNNTGSKKIYDVLKEAPFVNGLEVNLWKPYGFIDYSVWTKFKKPFSTDGRGGDSVEILDSTIDVPFLSAFKIDEIPDEIPQDEFFYVRDVFPGSEYTIANNLSSFCSGLHCSIETENVKLRIKGETIESGSPWENGASSVQTFPRKKVTYYFEKVPYIGISGRFTKRNLTFQLKNIELKYKCSFITGYQEVLWVKF